jgi:hypothetical protein
LFDHRPKESAVTWAAIVEAILAVLKPLLSELLRKWLAGRLLAAARTHERAGLQPLADGSGAADLLREAMAATPRRQVFRRAFLERALAVLPPVVAGEEALTRADRHDLKTLGAAAE